MQHRHHLRDCCTISTIALIQSGIKRLHFIQQLNRGNHPCTNQLISLIGSNTLHQLTFTVIQITDSPLGMCRSTQIILHSIQKFSIKRKFQIFLLKIFKYSTSFINGISIRKRVTKHLFQHHLTTLRMSAAKHIINRIAPIFP